MSLTPATSFDLRSNLGLAEERALLYQLIKKAWDIDQGRAPFNVLQGNVKDSDRFRRLASDIDPEADIDPDLAKRFSGILRKD